MVSELTPQRVLLVVVLLMASGATAHVFLRSVEDEPYFVVRIEDVVLQVVAGSFLASFWLGFLLATARLPAGPPRVFAMLWCCGGILTAFSCVTGYLGDIARYTL
ncbi:MAG: hypothetical protein U0166_03145 [Acidobacteriota bacterium]